MNYIIICYYYLYHNNKKGGLSGLKAKERDAYKCRSLIAQNRFREV